MNKIHLIIEKIWLVMALLLVCIGLYALYSQQETRKLYLYFGMSGLALIMFAIKRMQKRRTRTSMFGDRKR